MSANIRTVNIKGKAYVDVAERVRLVHADQKHKFEIVESMPLNIADRWIWKAVIKVDEKQYIGHAEIKLNAPKNTPDGSSPFECGETSAIGRALGLAGFGSAESIASLDEMYRAIASQDSSEEESRQERRIAPISQDGPATEQQLATIQKLQRQLGMEPITSLDGLSFADAAQLLKDYSQQLQAKRKSA